MIGWKETEEEKEKQVGQHTQQVWGQFYENLLPLHKMTDKWIQENLPKITTTPSPTSLVG